MLDLLAIMRQRHYIAGPPVMPAQCYLSSPEGVGRSIGSVAGMEMEHPLPLNAWTFLGMLGASQLLVFALVALVAGIFTYELAAVDANW